MCACVLLAVNGAAFASMVASGQTCIMGSRILIHESIYDEVVEKFARKIAGIRLGPPQETSTQMGPVIRLVFRTSGASNIIFVSLLAQSKDSK